MTIYKCGMCKGQVVANKQNPDGAVYFDGQYWHKDCFIKTCHSRIGNKRFKKYNWQDVLDNITEWQDEARKSMKLAIEKDEVYNFIISHYRISCTNKSLFTRLSSVYDGSYYGLVYPIPPDELLGEWEYYFPQLIEARKYKNMTDDQAVSYDLAILLTKNAEYRKMMEKKKVEEQVKAAQKSVEVEIDMSAIQNNTAVSRGNRRLANLYEEFIGGGNNG